jgi:hypothetical protein
MECSQFTHAVVAAAFFCLVGSWLHVDIDNHAFVYGLPCMATALHMTHSIQLLPFSTACMYAGLVTVCYDSEM